MPALFSLCAAGGTEIFVGLESSAAVGAKCSVCAGLGMIAVCQIHGSWSLGFVDGKDFVVTQGGGAPGAVNKSVCIPGAKIQLVVHIGDLCVTFGAGLLIGQTAAPLRP